MTNLQAAFSVLRESSRPMTADEITEAAISRGLIRPLGKTPAHSMLADLYLYVRAYPSGPIVRISEAAESRARARSVRWALDPLIDSHGAFPTTLSRIHRKHLDRSDGFQE